MMLGKVVIVITLFVFNGISIIVVEISVATELAYFVLYVSRMRVPMNAFSASVFVFVFQ